MRKRLTAGALFAAIAIFAGCARSDKSAASPGDGRVEVGAPAPSYATVSLNGDSVSLAGQHGKVVLLNIWATWCHPCRTEIPELRAIHERYRDRGLELIGVSVDSDGTDDAVRSFMKDFEMTFPVWRDPEERISTRFLAVGVPATFLIDRDGILRWRKTGPIAPGDTSLTAAIERALD
ncbi:MAG: TlpA family protein disulfide reductase [Gemmatimonadaceae bacterium]|nr:TlpA family protein disulfide reductase [Gemmatimonadaceae bacterium]